MEEMEKRSDRHIRDLVAHTAFKGLDANEIGCARISVMAGSNCPPSKGRIQMSKTNYLQTVISDLQRTAGPYRCAITGSQLIYGTLRQRIFPRHSTDDDTVAFLGVCFWIDGREKT